MKYKYLVSYRQNAVFPSEQKFKTLKSALKDASEYMIDESNYKSSGFKKIGNLKIDLEQSWIHPIFGKDKSVFIDKLNKNGESQ